MAFSCGIQLFLRFSSPSFVRNVSGAPCEVAVPEFMINSFLWRLARTGILIGTLCGVALYVAAFLKAVAFSAYFPC